MRQFYIFNINDEYKYKIKIDTYFLYKVFDEIHNINKLDIKYGLNIYNNTTNPINKKDINNKLYNEYKNDESYIKFMNNHYYNNYFSNEDTILTINNSYIKIESTSQYPIFFKSLLNNKNLFVCDFNNKDYFWLESIA